MCGITGYIGSKQAYPILLSGLQRLEYRGYDSAGICISHNSSLSVNKKKGRVQNLANASFTGTIGIGHTRWSTHGVPCDKNSHPFTDNSGQFAIVHNGIIENYLELKEELRKDGVIFTSDTDSEMIVHLVAKYFEGDLTKAVLKTIQRLQGAYAFCVMKNDTRQLVGARNGSPLVIGIGEHENFFASDVSAIVEHTKHVIYLNDFEVANITDKDVEIQTFHGQRVDLHVKTIDWDLQQAQKGGYKHFMLKEIYEQPQIVQECLSVEVALQVKPKRIIIVACGTASYAGMVGKYIIEKHARIPVINEIASEFRYKDPIVEPDDLVIAISQSGETADTLAAVRLAKQENAATLGFINVVDSTIAREVDHVIYTRAGPEIGVASTKAFMSQLVAMYTLAGVLAGEKIDLSLISQMLTTTLELDSQIKQIAQKYYLSTNFLYIGRNLHVPMAFEGALKLKEISYIHAEAYPAGELKHGPIALVSEEMPTVAICVQDNSYHKTYSNIEEIKARDGRVISIATQSDERIKHVSDDVIYVPKVDEKLYPFLVTIPLQLLAYHIADLRECDIDKPRNLAKSVTVE